MLQQLFDAAESMLVKSYAPYSGLNVGCAILCSNNKLFKGCNIENSSYRLTLCAEACAISQMVSDDTTTIQDIAIVNSKNTFCPPCGACRQMIIEFAHPKCNVHIKESETIKTYPIECLLPLAFKLK
jgi:cytidine deaminase